MSEKSVSSNGTRKISLHPLVLMNVADHHNRACGIRLESDKKIYGLLFGRQEGLKVDIINSFEVTYEVGVDSHPIISKDYVTRICASLKAVFPKDELIGWYTNGIEMTDADLAVQTQMVEFNESPLSMQFNPLADEQSSALKKEIPVSLYDAEVKIVGEVPTTSFVRTPFVIEYNETERIVVDHVAKTDTSASGTSTVKKHFTNMKEAVEALNARVMVLHQYLNETKEGKIPFNHQIVRKVASVCNQLPTIESQAFKDDFSTEYSDALLVTYLASITKGVAAVNELTEKYPMCFQSRSSNGGVNHLNF